MNLCARLAFGNLRRGARLTLPFLLCVAGTAAMFYNLCFLDTYPEPLIAAGDNELRLMLSFGVGVVAVFALVVLYYTNSFLLRRRKKEFGLLNVLGLEKRHLARMMAIETLMLALVGTGAGIALGILLSKLLLLLLLKLVRNAPVLGFSVSLPAIGITAAVFGAIFLLILASSVRSVVLARPAELLSASNAGEREPKTRWLLAAVGILTLGGGYTLALLTRDPIQAMGMFFIAVILVIIGTYCLFTAGSIAVLKSLRKNRRYYYQTRHFINVSGLIYRMKRNAAGLASICILSTMVLVTVSTTVSLYSGFDDMLRTMYPRNFAVYGFDFEPAEADAAAETLGAIADQHGVSRESLISYRYYAIAYGVRDGVIDFSNGYEYYSDGARFEFIPLASYNALMGESRTLSPGEALLYTPDKNLLGDSVDINGEVYRITERLSALNVPTANVLERAYRYYLIVPDDEAVLRIVKASNLADRYEGETFYYGFDTDSPDALQLDAKASVYAAFQGHTLSITLVCEQWSDYISIYGGLFFVGIILGLLFLMATVLIIYYKQVSEGFDDASRFEIMKKVGLSDNEVRGTVRSQVLTVFFLPLCAAFLHVAFAFPMILRMLRIFSLDNTLLFVGTTAATCLAFALVYTVIYGVTARSYYRIVNAA